VAHLDVSDSMKNCFDGSGMTRTGFSRNRFFKFSKAV